jgi:hypothetical protein
MVEEKTLIPYELKHWMMRTFSNYKLGEFFKKRSILHQERRLLNNIMANIDDQVSLLNRDVYIVLR